jgi:protein gp37
VGEITEIPWCSCTCNLWHGCTKVGGSPACDHCYAERDSIRYGFKIWGNDAPRRYFGDRPYNDLLKWDRKAQKEGVMKKVFIMSMGDWAEGRPEQVPYLDKLWDTFLMTKNLVLLMLTKRPQLINKLCPLRSQRIWHGTTAETQSWLDLRWLALSQVDAEVYFLSIEPMMEAMVLPDSFLGLGQRAWCIVGGESGSHARPLDMRWVRFLRDQCAEAGVPFFFKQGSQNNWGREFKVFENFPDDLKIRQRPEIKRG